MAFVSRIRLRFRPETGQLLERFYAETFVPGRRPLFASGDLLSMALLRIEVPGDRAETYDLVSHWANKAAHDHDEDSPLDQLGVTSLGRYLAAPGREVRRSQRRLHLQRFAVYALVSALVILLFVGSIVGLETLLVHVTGQSSALGLIVTTLAFAGLLQAVRGRLQAAVDRRFFRTKYAAAEALAAFGQLARSEFDAAQLTDGLLEVVMRTVQPEYAFLWLRSPDGTLQEAGRTRQIQPVMPTSIASRATGAEDHR